MGVRITGNKNWVVDVYDRMYWALCSLSQPDINTIKRSLKSISSTPTLAPVSTPVKPATKLTSGFSPKLLQQLRARLKPNIGPARAQEEAWRKKHNPGQINPGLWRKGELPKRPSKAPTPPGSTRAGILVPPAAAPVPKPVVLAQSPQVAAARAWAPMSKVATRDVTPPRPSVWARAATIAAPRVAKEEAATKQNKPSQQPSWAPPPPTIAASRKLPKAAAPPGSSKAEKLQAWLQEQRTAPVGGGVTAGIQTFDLTSLRQSPPVKREAKTGRKGPFGKVEDNPAYIKAMLQARRSAVAGGESDSD